MDVRAIIILEDSAVDSGPGATLPLVLIDVLGSTVLEHTIANLHEHGVTEISVVAEKGEIPSSEFRPSKSVKISIVKSNGQGVWRGALQVFNDLTDDGAEAVFLIHLSGYHEINWTALLESHLRSEERVTRVWSGTPAEPLNVFVLNSRYRNDAGFLLRNELRGSRIATGRYQAGADEYSNPLQDAGDLRQLAWDGLHLRCKLRPSGEEIRPGVWLGKNCRIDKGARLVAPVYVGRRARVRTGAVITRGSSIEHHSQVDCGTVVENASILPYSTIGAGLDVAHAVISKQRIFDLKRNLAVPIYDSRLIGEVSANAGIRTLAKAVDLASYLPMQFLRGLTRKTKSQSEFPDSSGVAASSDFTSGILEATQPLGDESSPELVAMRKYGDQ